MPIQTYRDPKTGKIYTSTGEPITSLEEYQRRVRSGELSGNPRDISELPKVLRTQQGIAIRPSASSLLGTLSNKQGLLEAARQIIQMKQEAQQPLTEAKAYWRTIAGAASTTPFGSKVEQGMLGGFKDKDFRLLSPAEQAQIRAARYGAAQAHLQGIQEEETKRKTRTEDILKSLSDLISAQTEAKDKQSLEEKRILENIAKRLELGLPITTKDYQSLGIRGVNNKIGGSVSWRHNNPGNIKFGPFAQKYGATKGEPAKDGGYFAVFPNVEAGIQAMKDLLKSKNYRNLDVDSALKRWSNNGYGIEIWQDSPYAQSTIMKNLDDKQLDNLVQHMIKFEGWKEGTVLGQTKENRRRAWTDAAVRSLYEKLASVPGNQYTINDLLNMSDEELAKLSAQYSQDLATQAYRRLNKIELVRNGVKPDEALVILTAFYNGASPEYVKDLVKRLNPPMPNGDKKVDAVYQMMGKQSQLEELRAFLSENK